jgi:hypothetical protein
MKIQEEIKFWTQARKLIVKGYGKPCKTLFMDCPGCRARITLSWIDAHIDLLKWAVKQDKMPNLSSDKHK